MRRLVVGFFDTTTEAQNAVTRLTNNGFDEADVNQRDCQTDTDTTNTEAAGNRERPAASADDADQTDGILGFFRSLLGSNDDDYYKQYADLASRCSVVAVHIDSVEESMLAVEILEDCGAVEVDPKG
ncbi:hypothetical protein GCM10023187_50980 [Nibrella viscosa]|uniref:Heat induced stress protein YflT n=1 Tax=Nibrella viscosa TaxID=1084524 RepID=A0ABP8KY80_9BACT